MTRASSPPDRRPRRHRRRRAARIFGAALIASVLFHLALALAPPFRVDLPDHLEPSERLTVVPPPEDPPPPVEVPAAPERVAPPGEPQVRTGGTPVVGADTTPVFIPHEVPPRLMNPDAVQRYLKIFYPMSLRVADVEGAVQLWLFVNESGRVTKLQVRQSSGSPAFDRLARTAAPLMAFRPALNQGQPVGVWVSLWLRFNLEEPLLEEAESRVAGTTSDTIG